MKTKFQKWFGLVTGVLTITILVTACAPPATPEPAAAPAQTTSEGAQAQPSGPITIEFWHGHTGPDGQVMQELVDQFMKENPDIKIQTTAVAWNDLFTKAELAVANNQGPDLVTMPMDRLIIYRDKVFKPVDDLLPGTIVKDKYDQGIWKGITLDGKTYGVPLDTHPYVLYYRKDLVEQAGLSPLPKDRPLTKEEFLTYAKALTKDGNFGFGFKQVAQHVWWDYWSFLLQWGGNMLTPDVKEAAMNSQAAQDALQYMLDLQTKEQVAPPDQLDWKTLLGMFNEGQVAMIMHGSWLIPALEDSKVAYDTAMLPQWGPGPYAAWANNHFFAFTRLDEQRTQAALKFVQWMGKPENSARWGLVSGNVPALLEARGEYAELDRNRPLVKTVEMINGYFFMMPYTTKSETLQYKIIVPGLEAIANGEKSVKDGLDSINEQMYEVLSE